MVKHSHAKRGHGIKSKLMAAVAMLLIASIMMVSTTYAWFTLSTAPEVTGITTSVGANGNLEMALLPTVDGSGNVYGSAGDAIKGISNATGTVGVTAANVTWGNLVNLSDESYGLGKIVLYPSKLKAETNAEGNPILNGEQTLEVPTYGSDGRVSGFKQVGMTGVYNNGAFYAEGYGVRAVGAASGMSALELAFRNAVAAGNAAANRANTAASASLSASGTKLATIGMDRKLNNKNSFEDGDVQAILDVFIALRDGALKYIDTALRNYVVAVYLVTQPADHPGTDDVVNTILDPTTTWDAIETVIGSKNLSFGENVNFGKVIDDYQAIQTSVNTSISALTTLINGSDSHKWEDFSTHAAKLVDITTMKIEGMTIDQLMQTNAAGEYVNAGIIMEAVQGKGLTMQTSGGLYNDIAVFCGNITASVRIDGVKWNGLTLNVKGTMLTQYDEKNGVYLTAIKGIVSMLNVTGGSGANLPISDYYGYAIDLAFRTNAAGSYLKLQSTGIDRVYSDNEANDATMGHGATMTFNANGITGYDPSNVVNLMECYRVVFYDPETLQIYGYARLDPATVSMDDAGNYTMELRMYDETKKEFKTGAGSDKICDLAQNAATAVSVLVYIDGTTITNADVATSNLSGKMNLQFASSAELKPMEYADLRNGSGAAAATEYSVTLPEDGSVTGNAKANSGEAYNFSVGSNYTLDAVTVGGIAVTPTDNAGGSYTIPADKVTGNIVITVTPVTTTDDTGN